jgi:hypothetical protein
MAHFVSWQIDGWVGAMLVSTPAAFNPLLPIGITEAVRRVETRRYAQKLWVAFMV